MRPARISRYIRSAEAHLSHSVSSGYRVSRVHHPSALHRALRGGCVDLIPSQASSRYTSFGPRVHPSSYAQARATLSAHAICLHSRHEYSLARISVSDARESHTRRRPHHPTDEEWKRKYPLPPRSLNVLPHGVFTGRRLSAHGSASLGAKPYMEIHDSRHIVP